MAASPKTSSGLAGGSAIGVSAEADCANPPPTEAAARAAL